VAAAQVYLQHLAVVVEVERAWPLQRSHNNNAAGNSWADTLHISIFHSVAHKTHDPSVLTAYLCVLDYLLQARGVRVSGFDSSLLGIFIPVLSIFWLDRIQMGSSAVFEDVEVGVDPHLWLLHLLSSWVHKVSFLGCVLFDFSRAVLYQPHDSLWQQSGGMCDAGDLSAKIVLFLSSEEGVGKDAPIEVT